MLFTSSGLGSTAIEDHNGYCFGRAQLTRAGNEIDRRIAVNRDEWDLVDTEFHVNIDKQTRRALAAADSSYCFNVMTAFLVLSMACSSTLY